MSRYNINVFCKNNIKLLGLIKCKKCDKREIITVIPDISECCGEFPDFFDINILFIPEKEKFDIDNYICDKCKNK